MKKIKYKKIVNNKISSWFIETYMNDFCMGRCYGLVELLGSYHYWSNLWKSCVIGGIGKVMHHSITTAFGGLVNTFWDLTWAVNLISASEQIWQCWWLAVYVNVLYYFFLFFTDSCNCSYLHRHLNEEHLLSIVLLTDGQLKAELTQCVVVGPKSCSLVQRK